MRKRKRILTLLALLTAAAGAWAQATATTSATRTGSDNTYKVKMKEGTKDAAKWTIASDGNSTTGDKTEGLTVAPEKEVTLTYSGRLKVKSVTATHDGWNGDLSNIPESALVTEGWTKVLIVPDGTTLTGTLDGETHPYKIVIPAGAKVTLAGVNISRQTLLNCDYAGINCEDGATIILADNTTNVVKGFHRDYPGIYIAEGKTLIIKGESLGTGSLTASSIQDGAGIGGGYKLACGNIIIQGGVITAIASGYSAGIGSGCQSGCGNITISGGTVTATGSGYSAGIGSGNESTCGNITISGGTVTATGGRDAAGIGSGNQSGCGNITISGGTVLATGGDYATAIGCGGNESCSCGDITITTGVTLIKATKSYRSYYCIGKELEECSCGTIRIGCTLDSDGNPLDDDDTVYYDGLSYQNGGSRYLAKSPFFYPYVDLSKLTSDYEATDGEVLKGTLNGSEQPYKVSIADGATVTLDGVDIQGVNDNNCHWAGLNCAGTATIILNDGSENTVKGFHLYYPGIFVPEGKYLTIKGGTLGNGKLTASPFDGGTDISLGAGIGGSFEDDCGAIEIQGGIITANGGYGAAGIGGSKHGNMGNITISGGEVRAKGGSLSAGIGSGFICFSISSISITGGTVNATGGQGGAGIGSGYGEKNGNTIILSSCGKITISGGTVTATGGRWAAGIGTGSQFSGCGKITITSGVDHVTAKKGTNAFNSIGLGRREEDYHNSCGTVTLPDDTSKVTQQ